MRKDTLNKVGLAAVILLAPGGFILGGVLATRYYRNKLAKQGDADGAAGPEPTEKP